MDLVLMTVAAGVIGTIVMDVLNHAFARAGLIAKIDLRMIGRIADSWLRGRFFLERPDLAGPPAAETIRGCLAHYGTGLGLALVYVIGWRMLVGGSVAAVWALPYGLATTAVSWFLVYPSLGQGAFGRRSGQGVRPAVSSLANHGFFGVGMAMGIVLVPWVSDG